MSYMLRTRVDGEFDDIVAETIDALGDEGSACSAISTFEKRCKRNSTGLQTVQNPGRMQPAVGPSGDSRRISNSGRCSPCNIVVYDDDDNVVVSAVDPQRLIGVAENDDLDPIGDDASERFERVLESL